MTKGLPSREVIKMLKKDGWHPAGVDGSHHQYQHAAKAGRVTVTHPVKDIPVGTLRSIYRQAGWDWRTRKR